MTATAYTSARPGRLGTPSRAGPGQGKQSPTARKRVSDQIDAAKAAIIADNKLHDSDTGSPEVQVALLTAHQPPQRPPVEAQEGPPQPARPADAGGAPAPAARLRPIERRRALPGDHRQERSTALGRPIIERPSWAAPATSDSKTTRQREGRLPVAVLRDRCGQVPMHRLDAVVADWEQPRCPIRRTIRREGVRPMADPIVVSTPLTGTDTTLIRNRQAGVPEPGCRRGPPRQDRGARHRQR